MSRKMTPSQATAYYREIAQQIRTATQSTVKVGVIGGQGAYEDGTKLIDVASAHEYGIGTKRRSFLRMPFAVKSKEMQSAIDEQMNNIIEGRSDAMTALNTVGVVAQSISQGAFTTQGYGNWESLKESTIKSKGSSQILIDTGKLRQSITWEVK